MEKAEDDKTQSCNERNTAVGKREPLTDISNPIIICDNSTRRINILTTQDVVTFSADD